MASETPEPTPSVFNAGKLVNVDWSLGVSVNSDSSVGINQPYVTLLFRVADGEGKTRGHCAELSFEQFRAFRATLADAHASL